MNKREVEIIEHWRRELENIYKRRYESLGSLQVDIKGLLERMGNRATILNKMVREAQ